MRAAIFLGLLALATGVLSVPVMSGKPTGITAVDLTPALVANFTAVNGAGTRYAACRLVASGSCDAGLQCCGYLGSQLAAGAEGGKKLPDTCVPNRPSECPRTVVGAMGGPCGRRGFCQAGLKCCYTVHYLGGITDPKLPTCQAANGCPAKTCNRRRGERC
ncbi:laminin subunit alpha-2 isoform E [Chlorella sorokiniana]|uniref:Laminin subunit alpha-2 isoform E n=1 Tax=Chlorella sorokiniana TaxID=3076 RepID=A0A2P6U519_CHLSO|nr:laminin subunit alpha-2 isoform E [Chlorella sorokiniana]|eukprot:PRW61362.1 laminin subunit alpha-2 isoform E [Chlorella sorokiniana]